jgi:shikimate kinase
MKIILIGFMGCGKSYIGQKLAAILGYTFLDLDTVIEDKEGVSIAQLFDNKGETYFRKIESDCLKSLASLDNVVIATGGGAPCFQDNMTWMNANGTTVYLKTHIPLLAKRLKNQIDHRPLLRGKSYRELVAFIKTRVREREAHYYKYAHITVKQAKDGEGIIAEIVKKCKIM